MASTLSVFRRTGHCDSPMRIGLPSCRACPLVNTHFAVEQSTSKVMLNQCHGRSASQAMRRLNRLGFLWQIKRIYYSAALPCLPMSSASSCLAYAGILRVRRSKHCAWSCGSTVELTPYCLPRERRTGLVFFPTRLNFDHQRTAMPFKIRRVSDFSTAAVELRRERAWEKCFRHDRGVWHS